MEHEATMQFFTNLGRSEVEAKLHEAQHIAQSADLYDVADALGDIEGMSADDLDGRVKHCLGLLAGNQSAKRLSALLEMIQMNLPNLK